MSVETLERIPPARDPSASYAYSSLAAFATRSVLPGFVATSLLSVGALGVGWVPASGSTEYSWVNGVLRTTMVGSIVSGALVTAGVLLLLGAWLALGREIRTGLLKDHKRLWFALAVWCSPLLVTPPLFSRDVYSYVAQGNLMVSGLNPYEHGVSSLPGWASDGVDPLWADSPTPYGQFFLLIARAVADLSGHATYTGVILFRLTAVAGVVLLAWGVPVLAATWGFCPMKSLWLGVLNPLVLMHFISGAHNDALMVGLLAAGLALVARNQSVAGVALVALGGTVKPIGLIALPFAGMIWAGPTASMGQLIRRWGVAATITVAVLATLSWLTGTGTGWVASIGTPSEVRTWLSPPTAVGMAVGAVLDSGGLQVTDGLVTAVRLVCLVIGLVAILYLVLRSDRSNPVRLLALAFLVVLVLGPVVQPWYLLWTLPLLASTPLLYRRLQPVLYCTTALALFGVLSHFCDGLWYR